MRSSDHDAPDLKGQPVKIYFSGSISRVYPEELSLLFLYGGILQGAEPPGGGA